MMELAVVLACLAVLVALIPITYVIEQILDNDK